MRREASRRTSKLRRHSAPRSAGIGRRQRNRRARLHRPCEPSKSASSSSFLVGMSRLQRMTPKLGAPLAATTFLLLGASGGLSMLGFVGGVRFALTEEGLARFQNPIEPLAVGMALLAIALGIAAPLRWASHVVAKRRTEGQRQESASSDPRSSTPMEPDQVFYWSAFAALAMAAGLLIVTWPVSLGPLAIVHHWLDSWFLWSDAPRLIIQAAMLFFSALLPMAGLGASITSLQHLLPRIRSEDGRGVAWLVVGAGAALACSGSLLSSPQNANLLLLLAGVPAFLVAIGAAVFGSFPTSRTQVDAGFAAAALPGWSDRRPRLLRAATAAIGGGSACAITVWSSPALPVWESPSLAAGWLLCALGAGMLLSGTGHGGGAGSIGHFAATSVAAGIMVAIGTCGSEQFAMHAGIASAIVAALALGAVGFAAGSGRHTLMTRAVRRAGVDSTLLARWLVWAALTAWIGAPVVMNVFGPFSTLALLALSLVALGGVLMIHESSPSPRGRRLRLYGVWGTVCVMLLLALLPIRRGSVSLADHPSNNWPARGEASSPASNGR